MKTFDYVICHGRVVDGTGSPWFFADVGIKGDRIVAIGKIDPAAAENVIEADGRFLVPGFIDAHVHTDLKLLEEPDLPSSVFQGVTSHIIGQDGISYAPSSLASQKHTRRYFAGVNGDPEIDCQWESVKDYLRCFDRRTAVNIAYLLPQGTIRMEVMGLETREPTPEEMREMQVLVAQGMRDGAVGISTGLDYVPCVYSGTRELIDVCRPAGELGGVYVTHIRSYGDRITEAVAEAVEIGREAGIPVHISHYNGRAELLGRLVDDARAAGSDLTFDTYPYLAGCSILSMVALPRWMEEGGSDATLARLAEPDARQRLEEYCKNPVYPVEALRLSSIDFLDDQELEGLFVPEAAAKRGESISDFICNLLIRSRLKVSCIAHHSNRTEDDVIALMRHPAHMGGSDGVYTGSKPHPRGFGTFARYLEYVRDHNVMSLEEMIGHLSYHPARRFHLKGRGQIAVGCFADLALFDLGNIRGATDYGKEPQMAAGMDWVFVNGIPVLAQGAATGKRPAVAVRGPGTLA